MVGGLGLTTIKLCTKYEISKLYERRQKCKNLDRLGVMGSLQVIGNIANQSINQSKFIF